MIMIMDLLTKIYSKYRNWKYWLTHDKALAQVYWDELKIRSVVDADRIMRNFKYTPDKPFDWIPEYLVAFNAMGDDCDGAVVMWKALLGQKLMMCGDMYTLRNYTPWYKPWRWIAHRIYVVRTYRWIGDNDGKLHICSNHTRTVWRIYDWNESNVEKIILKAFPQYNTITETKETSIPPFQEIK